jgi:HAD superfamily hydrolase (TIGR01509 family)
MIKAVVFDMDGLLVDSEPLWQRARIEACGAERLQWTDADQKHVMGSSTLGWAAYLAERLNHEYPVEEIIDRVLAHMVKYYREDVPLLPGARAVIEQLRGRYPLGLASGSSMRLLQPILETAGWNETFDEVLSTDDLERGKPAPDVYLEITRRMGVPTAHTAIFEDSTNGILSGHRAGVKVIAVPSYYLPPPDDVLQKADLVLHSLSDFTLNLLEQL